MKQAVIVRLCYSAVLIEYSSQLLKDSYSTVHKVCSCHRATTVSSCTTKATVSCLSATVLNITIVKVLHNHCRQLLKYNYNEHKSLCSINEHNAATMENYQRPASVGNWHTTVIVQV